MKFVLFVIFVSHVLVHTNGLKCFTCTLTVPEGQEDTIDMSCLNKPEDAPGRPVLTCPARMKYCTIVRIDSKITNSMTSMERNCGEKPLIENDDVESDAEITHFRSCTTDLCNSGKGDEDPNYGNPDGGGVGGMVVPGKSNSNTHFIFRSLFILPAFVIFISGS